MNYRISQQLIKLRALNIIVHSAIVYPSDNVGLIEAYSRPAFRPICGICILFVDQDARWLGVIVCRNLSSTSHQLLAAGLAGLMPRGGRRPLKLVAEEARYRGKRTRLWGLNLVARATNARAATLTGSFGVQNRDILLHLVSEKQHRSKRYSMRTRASALPSVN